MTSTFFANALKNETVKSSQLTKTVTYARLPGPYAMFGPGRTIQTVPNTTMANGTSMYKITEKKEQNSSFLFKMLSKKMTSKTSCFGCGRCAMNTTVLNTTSPVVNTTLPVVKTAQKMSYFGNGRIGYNDTTLLILNSRF